MPYVTVIFDPIKISQEIVDELKSRLQGLVADALSSLDSLEVLATQREEPIETLIELIKTSPEQIMVTQHTTHPTDINVPPLEIYIQAGRPKGRSGDKVVSLISRLLPYGDRHSIPAEYLGEGQSGIFITFHEHNGFGFIPRRIGT